MARKQAEAASHRRERELRETFDAIAEVERLERSLEDALDAALSRAAALQHEDEEDE